MKLAIITWGRTLEILVWCNWFQDNQLISTGFRLTNFVRRTLFHIVGIFKSGYAFESFILSRWVYWFIRLLFHFFTLWLLWFLWIIQAMKVARPTDATTSKFCIVLGNRNRRYKSTNMYAAFIPNREVDVCSEYMYVEKASSIYPHTWTLRSIKIVDAWLYRFQNQNRGN